MRYKQLVMALVALVALALLPTAARADDVTFSFTPSAYNGAAGSVVTLFGTFENGPGAITFTGYLESLQAGLTLFGAVQPFDSIVGLASNQTLGPVARFNVMIAAGTPDGTVFSFAANQFSVFYQPSVGDEVEVAANFSITVQGGGPGGDPIPEPATMVLLGTGLAGVAARLRKRRRAKTP